MLQRKDIVDIVSSDERFGEKCGVIGVWTDDDLVRYFTRIGLSTLQHRGQESAGISIYTEDKKIKTYKGMGLVPNVLSAEVLQELGESKAAIGHNRYSTTGSSSVANAQPITLQEGEYQLSIGHNGNIPDLGFLGEDMKMKNEEEHTSDTHLIAKVLLKERPNYSDWDETLLAVLPHVRGAFCFVIMTSDGTIYGARDPYGIRPFCLGKIQNGWIIASESVAIDLNHGEFLRDIKPGEIVKIDYDGSLSSFFFGEPKRPQNCIFEYIYFSRPDSFENGVRVKRVRETSGKFLGERILRKKIKADMVVPVFDSGYPAARGVASVVGLPLVDAITVSHYVGRTFIQPGQENRMAAVSGKHNIVPDEIIGKRLIVVDDSAVRLTTSRRLFHNLKEAGAKEVYMVFASPPVVNHCDMGIDMKSKKELPAAEWEHEPFEVLEENIGKLMGADGVVYLPIDEIARAVGGVKEDYYHFPFGGPHPIRGAQYEFPKKKRVIESKAKIAVLISGNGTNLQNIIDQVKSGEIDAEITCVISNKENAFGLKRAKDNTIPTYVLPFDGKVKDKAARRAYDKKLFAYVKKLDVDMIVLAGWMMVLGDEFLTSMTEMEVPVINLHPALLTSGLEDHIWTSRGSIPVIRGTHAIKDAFDRGLLVSGVTVHQILAKNYVDMGPVVMKEEVRRQGDDTLEAFEKRVHEAEKRMLPAAIKRIVHVMKQGVDVSRGNFFW